MIKLFKVDRDLAKSHLRGTDVSSGVCAATAIDFCYNELSGFHRSRVPYELTKYYSGLWRFIPRQRAYNLALKERKINSLQIVSPTDGLDAKYVRVTSKWDRLSALAPGAYILNMFQQNGTGHSVVLVKREFWVFFNPSYGALVLDKGIGELIHFLNKFIPIKKVCIMSVTKNGNRPVNTNPITSFKSGPLPSISG